MDESEIHICMSMSHEVIKNISKLELIAEQLRKENPIASIGLEKTLTEIHHAHGCVMSYLTNIDIKESENE